MVVRRFTVKNPHGLHARPAAELIKIAKELDCQFFVRAQEGADWQLAGIMNLIMLAAAQGCEIDIGVSGEKAESCLNRFAAVFEK